LEAWERAAPLRNPDIMTKLIAKVELLEAEVVSLKRELKREKRQKVRRSK
jgi:hypothetical protein